MITVTFLGKSISVNSTPVSNYAVENSVYLEQALQFLVDVSRYETLEQELSLLLGRLPSANEIAGCQISPKEYYQNFIIPAAQKHGANVMNDFMSDNIILGITAAGKTKLIGDACKDIQYWLSVGSLYEASNAIDTFVHDASYEPYITVTKFSSFKAKILAFFN